MLIAFSDGFVSSFEPTVPGSQSSVSGEVFAEPADVLELQPVVGGREVDLVGHLVARNQELFVGLTQPGSRLQSRSQGMQKVFHRYLLFPNCEN